MGSSSGEVAVGSVDESAVVDLRSDTVTRPSAEMRRALAQAEVGDDVLGDDPTTRRLEDRVAAILGKEQALFFPSGIMANQTALAVLADPGSEVVLEQHAHIVEYEYGAAAALSGLQVHPVVTPDGLLTSEHVESAIRSTSRYLPVTGVIAIENTHMDSGGRVMPLEVARGIRETADRHGLSVHLDGARLWHACAANGRSPGEYATFSDTVMVALSKGLGAPVGSVLAGPAELMGRAWRVRRRFGGGLRQSGVLAAAGIYALDNHMPDIAASHVLAKELETGVRELDGLRSVAPETNVVFIHLEDPEVDPDLVLQQMAARGVLMSRFGPRRLRAVTHRDVDSAGITRAVAVLGECLRGTAE